MDSLQNFTTFTKTYYNVVCSRDALSHFIRCWWEIISSVQILLYACTTFPYISFERHEGKDKIKCYFMPLLCTFLYIYFEYELYVWCQWVRRKNIIVFYEICSSILSKYCNIMVIIIFITPRDDVMQTLYIVWAEWWWRLLSPLAGHVWYGVAHNSIFLHLFFYSSAPSQCQGKHSNSKISFHRWKKERERWLPYIFTGMPTFYPGFVYIKVNSNIQLTFALLLHYECKYFGFSRGKKKMENYSLHFRT